MSALDLIQYHSDGLSREIAESELSALREQEGFLSGRLLDSKNIQGKFAVQALFQVDDEPGSPLPDGMKWVKVPESLFAMFGIDHCGTAENPQFGRGKNTVQLRATGPFEFDIVYVDENLGETVIDHVQGNVQTAMGAAVKHARQRHIRVNPGNPDLGPYPTKQAAERAFRASSLRFGRKAKARYEKLGDGWYFSPRASNPESDAASVYEEFHGVPSTEVIEVEEDVHFHEHLAVLGELRSIKVLTPRGKKIEIQFPASGPKTWLASNEAKDQLFIEGGDQSLDLEALGFKPSDQREKMLIGEAHEITYFTEKQMHDLEPVEYYHHLGEETGQRPVLLYDTRSSKLSLAGGEYAIRPEGIVN